jgi:UDP-N-acetylmuramyl pentapeptide phosphotransferase/UDP-N-acetylglucosamine-1-phosphate transferase
VEIVLTNPLIRILIALAVSFGLCLLFIPPLVEIAKLKSIVKLTNARTSHSGEIPILGGVAILASFLITSLISIKMYLFPDLQYTIVGLIVISMVGIRDDVLEMRAWIKLIGQILGSLLAADMGWIRLTSLHGFLGIYEIHHQVAVLLTVFVFIVIINSFNLIDGIDGLASGVGILVSATFGIWFFLAKAYEMSIISFSLIGALIAYFYFNVFGKKRKLFMGDTGSLVIGYIVAVMAVWFNELNLKSDTPYLIHAAPAVSMGILALPLFDTIRVFTLRILKRRSPFDPDRLHIHHKLHDLGLSHLSVTLILLAVNIFFIILSFTLQLYTQSIPLILGILLIGCVVLSTVPFYFLRNVTRDA